MFAVTQLDAWQFGLSQKRHQNASASIKVMKSNPNGAKIRETHQAA